MLYVFEDNEAVIKMIITGRCPTRRHVSRTHRVSLDWLLDIIIADILTKGNFTRDEWNNLLHLFNISHFIFSGAGEEPETTSAQSLS